MQGTLHRYWYRRANLDRNLTYYFITWNSYGAIQFVIFIKIYYGITQFCLFGSIGIVTITAFDRFLTIKSSNLSTRRFRYHLYSVFILLFSGKKSLHCTHHLTKNYIQCWWLVLCLLKRKLLIMKIMLATLNAKLIGALSGESFLFIDRFVEMKKAKSMLETKCVGYKSASQKCHLSLKILFPL